MDVTAGLEAEVLPLLGEASEVGLRDAADERSIFRALREVIPLLGLAGCRSLYSAAVVEGDISFT